MYLLHFFLFVTPEIRAMARQCLNMIFACHSFIHLVEGFSFDLLFPGTDAAFSSILGQ